MIDEDLPGADLVRAGLDSLARDEETDEALLIRVAATRLRELEIDVPPLMDDPQPAEQRLYLRLVSRLGRPAGYRAYNALLERLVSFEDALAGQRARARRRAKSDG